GPPAHVRPSAARAGHAAAGGRLGGWRVAGSGCGGRPGGVPGPTTRCPGRIGISPGTSSPWATSGSELRGLSSAGGTIADDLGLDHTEQAGHLAAWQSPMLRGVRDDLDESEVRILTAV